MARRQRPIVVETLLAEASGTLQPVLRRAASMRAEEANLRTLLDTEVSDNADAVYVRGDTLTVVVRSSVWATRVRFLAPAILQRFASARDLPTLRRIHVSVGGGTPDEATYQPPRPTMPSPAAAEVLSQTAATLSDDDPLRGPLERIASRAAKRRQS